MVLEKNDLICCSSHLKRLAASPQLWVGARLPVCIYNGSNVLWSHDHYCLNICLMTVAKKWCKIQCDSLNDHIAQQQFWSKMSQVQDYLYIFLGSLIQPMTATHFNLSAEEYLVMGYVQVVLTLQRFIEKSDRTIFHGCGISWSHD